MNFRNRRQLCITVTGAALNFNIEACSALECQQEKFSVSYAAAEIRHILRQGLAAGMPDIAVEHIFFRIFRCALIHEKCFFKLDFASFFKSLNNLKGFVKILAEANRTVMSH